MESSSVVPAKYRVTINFEFKAIDLRDRGRRWRWTEVEVEVEAEVVVLLLAEPFMDLRNSLGDIFHIVTSS